MPIYEYACGKCQHEFEVKQRITDNPVRSCPKCRSRKVKRLISQTSFLLKGSGWHADLYASPKSDASADKKDSADKKESADKKDSAEKSADSAPAADTKSDSPSKPKDKGKGKRKGAKAAA